MASDASTTSAASPSAGDAHLRPPYGSAAVAALAVFALYAVTLARTTAFWDTSEYIATAHILGIPHPPGNPLFVVLARAWAVLLEPLGLAVAVRVNLFSALMSALAHGLWFLVVHHVLRFFSDDRRFRLTGAAVAVLVSATAFTVWNQSNVNEKVYTVSLLTIALLSWLVFRWQENLGRGKDDNLLVLMVFILALSVGNHLMAFLAAPAIVIFILLVHPRTLVNWRLYPTALVAALLGLSIHLFLPLRAGLDPIINEAAPTCPDFGSALTAVVTYGKAGCVALSEALNRTQYDKPPITERQAAFWSQIVNYLQYFDWQWARGMGGDNSVFANIRLPFTMLFTGLGVWGAIEHFRRDRASFFYVAALFGTLSLALVYYLNFRYGFTLEAPIQNRELHEVRERDYFFIVGFSVWGLWAGVGIATLWKEAAEELETSLARTAPILGLALIPLVSNWAWASRADDYAARDWAYNLLMSVEPYGVLFTNGDNDTFPLWYLQEAEGVRRDVTVIVTSYLNTGWYTKQLRDLTAPCPEGVSPADHPTRIVCQRPYTFENTGAAYVADSTSAQGKVPLVLGRPVVPPTKTILPLDDATIDRVEQTYSQVQQDQIVRLGSLNARLRAGQLLYPWMQYALVLISSSMDERPIYFASSGSAAAELGLAENLIRQGLAYRLHPVPLDTASAPPGVLRMEPTPYIAVIGDWLDTRRTRTLLGEVFVHRGGIPDAWAHWPDEATIGIPNYYGWTYLALAQAAVQRGDREEAARWEERAQAWLALGT